MDLKRITYNVELSFKLLQRFNYPNAGIFIGYI